MIQNIFILGKCRLDYNISFFFIILLLILYGNGLKKVSNSINFQLNGRVIDCRYCQMISKKKKIKRHTYTCQKIFLLFIFIIL